MLSICIPVYNYLVEDLVRELHGQAIKLNIDFEIILIDDFSKITFKEKNKQLSSLNHIKYIELHENIGRSKIRNKFLAYASFDYLLFLDCDAGIVSELFIKNYIDAIHLAYPVICGGLIYCQEIPEKESLLRWKYGHNKEFLSLAKRLKDPFHSFKTINFLIQKDLFRKLNFDERISGYGHEDTWFGFELKKEGYQILHIDNPVRHNQLETNELFMIKTEQSIQSLICLKYLDKTGAFEKEITLVQSYNKLKKTGLLFLIKYIFIISKPAIRKILISGFANLYLYAFYKLGYLVINLEKEPSR